MILICDRHPRTSLGPEGEPLELARERASDLLAVDVDYVIPPDGPERSSVESVHMVAECRFSSPLSWLPGDAHGPQAIGACDVVGD